MNIPSLLAEKRLEILKIAYRYGAYNIRIFGSVIRGEAVPGSDMDILVDMESGPQFFGSRWPLARTGSIIEL